MGEWRPGPWVVDYDNDYGCDGGFSEWLTAGPAVIYLHSFRSSKENQANAHLIAAAPDLYEALERARASLLEHGIPEDGRIIPEINAALAKARGES